MKIEVTSPAKDELVKVLANKKDPSKLLRIYIAGYGWGGPTFGLALDELKDEDMEFKVEDFNFIMEDLIVENYGSFVVDFSDNWLRRGFSVYPDGVQSSC